MRRRAFAVNRLGMLRPGVANTITPHRRPRPPHLLSKTGHMIAVGWHLPNGNGWDVVLSNLLVLSTLQDEQ